MSIVRVYTDEQRAAIYELYRQGKNGPEIEAACKAGEAGVEAFEPKLRSIYDIVRTEEKKAKRAAPETLDDTLDPDRMRRFPARVMQVLEEEVDRIGKKHRLSPEHLHQLGRVVDVYRKLNAKPKKRSASPSSTGSEEDNGDEAWLAELAAEMEGETSGDEDARSAQGSGEDGGEQADCGTEQGPPASQELGERHGEAARQRETEGEAEGRSVAQSEELPTRDRTQTPSDQGETQGGEAEGEVSRESEDGGGGQLPSEQARAAFSSNGSGPGHTSDS